MNLTLAQKASMIEGNEQEYGRSYNALTWVHPSQAIEAEAERASLVAAIREHGEIYASGTKMVAPRLSPGCRSCMEGQWSCLFINGICNGRCFYCPTPQDTVGDPTTNRLTFSSPEAYADYVAALGFTGMSITGGEPFLTFERSLAYIQAVRERVGPAIHIWLYTNGTRVTRERLKALAAAGLDELRFDIGAINYTLKKPAMAQGIIPTVTVEIPLVPEEATRIKTLLPSMIAAGVTHLNLHQMRLTPHNIRHLAWKEYTFLHGNRATVLESELGALGIVRHALDGDMDIGVNYCSFVYKHRFQGAGARSRAARLLTHAWETITPSGYIRKCHLSGNTAVLNGMEARLQKEGHSGLIARTKKGLLLPAQLVPMALPPSICCHLAYDEATLSQQPETAPTIPIIPGRGTLHAERTQKKGAMRLPEPLLSSGDLETALQRWAPATPFESIKPGLLPYF